MKTATMNPIFVPLRKLYDWVMHWADHPHSVKALAIITFMEASFFPIPTDPLLAAMAVKKPRRGFYFAVITTIFSVLGALFGYAIGSFAWHHLEPLFFQYILSQEKFDLVVQQFSQHVFLTIFVAGFSPIPFKVFTVAGGVAAVPLGPFVGAAILSRGLRYCMIGGLIFVFGKRIEYWLDHYFERMTMIVSGILVLLVVLLKLIL